MNKINQVNFFKMQNIEPMHLNGNISLNEQETNVKSSNFKLLTPKQ